MKRALLGLGMAVLLCGCGNMLEKRFFPKPTAVGDVQGSQPSGPDRYAQSQCKPVSRGSLWPVDDHVFFYGDKKALRVGDIITVRIVENAEASNTADTDLSRSSTRQCRPQHVFR